MARSRREFFDRGWTMQLPGPVGPAWNLRLFRHVSLIFFLTPCALDFICLGLRLLPEAAVFATSATIFGCTWLWARRYTGALEKWGRRPGYGQGSHLADPPAADVFRPD